MKDSKSWVLRIVFAIAQFPSIARAQILPDATLPNHSIVTPNGHLNEITGGTAAGRNLFHSFEQFNVPTGSEAFFNNPLTIDNIITRVTGGSISNIDGLIRANGTANLFLLNPNGIVFGPNARLDIGGSFLGSTADSLLFEDGSVYSATDPNAPPLLTVNVPIGLQLGPSAAPIRVQGSGHNLSFAPETFATIRDDRPDGFQVRPGQTLALVGGHISLVGGNLTAPSGQIELASVIEGSVAIAHYSGGWSFRYEGVENFGDIRLSQAASVDTSGNGGGTIQVQAQRLVLEDGSSILADTLGDGSGEGVSIRTTEWVDVRGVSPDGLFASSVSTAVAPGASGAGGHLSVETDRLLLSNEGVLGSDTFGSGHAGTLTVRAREVDMSVGFLVTAARETATGDGGSLRVEVHRLRVADGAQILTFTLGEGNAGDLTIRATETVEVTGVGESFGFDVASALAATAEFGSTGNAGDLTIETGRLRVANGGGISSATDGTGDSGNLSIRATDLVEVVGNSAIGMPSNIFTSIFTGDAPQDTELNASAGQLSIETGRLIVRDGGQISAGGFEGGEGGDLTVQASEAIELSGSIAKPADDVLMRNFFRDESGMRIPSGLFAASEGSGTAGNLSIVTPELMVRDGAEVTVGSRDEGMAGSLEIEASEIHLDTGGQLHADSRGGLGNINLMTGDLQLRRQSGISTNVTGTDRGGNITIETETLVALENSDISANATNSNGGMVTIRADGIFGTALREQPTPDSDITASSALGTAFSGMVNLQTPNVDPSAGLVPFAADTIDPSQLLARSCLAPSDRKPGRFVIVGLGGLPAQPDDPFNLPFETYSIPLEEESRPMETEEGRAASPRVMVEAEGIFILEDDRLVLGRECL